MADAKILMNLRNLPKIETAGTLKTSGLLRASRMAGAFVNPRPPDQPPPPPVAAAPPPAPATPPADAQPLTNPFLQLPFPSPGDRIRAQDFQTLSQCLQLIHEISVLSGALVGSSFGDAKLALASQRFSVDKAMSVFGAELPSPQDGSLDERKVIQVAPIELGERRVAVILTEAVETRRFVPNLLGLSHKEATERLKAMVGDIGFSGAPVAASSLVGLTLGQSKDQIS